MKKYIVKDLCSDDYWCGFGWGREWYQITCFNTKAEAQEFIAAMPYKGYFSIIEIYEK